MKKNIVNILATTGISLLLLSVVALFFHASCIYLETVFQAFCINIITHIGIMIIQKIKLRNIFTEMVLEILFIVGELLVFGRLFHWFTSLSFLLLVFMGVVIYIISYFLNLLQMKQEAIEIVFIKTDQTWIGENILHKICCILLIWSALDMLRLHWSDLGFSKKGLFAGLKYGLALGISTFFLSYVAEFIVLFVMGKHASLRFYITNFSLTQSHTNGSSLLAVVVCVIGNIINVYAEEGLFRGLFCKIGIQYYSQKTANIIQALLFGIWHITNVINPLLDGSMNIAMAAFMGIGYILLSGILAYEWGMCAALSGTLWIGASEHLFNNFISNSLHTVTETGADELMIIRITLSNILSLIFVLIISQKNIHSK